MHMKSLLADDTASGSASMRSHLVSRLHKAHSHAAALRQLLLDPSSNASENDILEASAYAASLGGSEAFERSQWEESIKSFAISRVIYSALLEGTKNDIYKDQLTSTIDPSIRYSAYQLKLPRNMDAAAISRKYFPQDSERLVSAVQILDPKAFSDPTTDTPEAGGARVSSLTWRSRTAPVEDADISAALSNAQIAENTYRTLQQENPSSTETFDGTLLAWQEAVDATKRAIDQLAKEVGMGDQKMQNLQLIWTVVNYSLICWRIGRNRVMIEGIAQGGKKRKDELRVKKLGHLKEEVALYDAILQVNIPPYPGLPSLDNIPTNPTVPQPQSLELVYDLPGVAADEVFVQELDAKKGYFTAQKCSIIAQSHAILSNRTNALALFHRALTHTASAPPLSEAPSVPSYKGLEVTRSQGQLLRSQLEAEVARFRALVEMDLIAAKADKTAIRGTGVIAERLDQYPEGKIDFQNGIVEWPPKVSPVPVKPVFLDVAFNFIEYPGDGAPRAVADTKEEPEGKKGSGFLGSLWGR